MKRVLILEDNRAIADAISAIVSEVDVYAKIDIIDTVAEAFQKIYEHIYDLFIVDIILDVEKPADVSGMIFVDKLRQNLQYEYTPVIFITSLVDPKFHAYSELHCYGYIEKPFSVLKVKKVISMAINMPMKQYENEFLYFRKEGILYTIKASEIIYIENSNHELLIHTMNEIINMPYKTLAELSSMLGSRHFIRCNRSTILNCNFIENIDPINRYIQMKHIDDRIEIGFIMKKQFLKDVGYDDGR